MKIETLAIHAANPPNPLTGDVVSPIHLSTTFARNPQGELIGEDTYARTGNPNRKSLEDALTALEGGVFAAAFASGVAAIHAVLQTLAPGDHVIAPTDVYHGTRDLMFKMREWGLEIDFVDVWEMESLERHLRDNTKLVFLETPSNPMLRITDISAASALVHARGGRIAVDSTWPTPVLQRPFDHGADVVVHSSTKYFGGHSDVLGGVVIVKEAGEISEKIAWVQKNGGAVPSPFDCWLLRRGLMTLPLRIRAQSEAAAKVAEFLDGHPKVKQVHYPGLPGHPGHAIAKKQMSMFGAMLSFQVAEGESAAADVARRTKLYTQATSLGAVESLIEHRFAVEGPRSKTPRDLLRVSIGLEHPDDLIADFAQALA